VKSWRYGQKKNKKAIGQSNTRRSRQGNGEASYDLWLDPGMTNVEAVSEMLKPFDARLMRCYPVSTRINYVANDDEACSAPVELIATQAGLFS
jgi:hypothetical protein